MFVFRFFKGINNIVSFFIHLPVKLKGLLAFACECFSLFLHRKRTPFRKCNPFVKNVNSKLCIGLYFL